MKRIREEGTGRRGKAEGRRKKAEGREPGPVLE